MAKKKTALSKFLKSITVKPVSVRYQIDGDEEELVFHIRPSVPFSEKLKMQERIADSLLANGTYYPSAYWPIVWYEILGTYTDLPMSSFGGKDVFSTLDSVASFVSETDIRGEFKQALGEDEYNGLMTEIADTVKREIENAKPLNRFLSALVANNGDENDVPKVTEQDLTSLKEIAQKIGGLTESDVVKAIIEQEKEKKDA